MNTICYRRKRWRRKKSKDPNCDRLKTIKQKPRKVMLRDLETGELKTIPSIYKAAKFIDQAPQTVCYWNGRVWNNKYIVVVL